MAGIRFEMPKYPSLKNNYNEDFARCEFGGVRYSTDQVPSAKISVSPRVGFNWDITGERKYVLRGGIDIFVKYSFNREVNITREFGIEC